MLDSSPTRHFAYWTLRLLRGQFAHIHCVPNTSSAVAEMGDRGHNRRGPKRGRGAVPLSRNAGNPSNTMWLALRSTSVPIHFWFSPKLSAVQGLQATTGSALHVRSNFEILTSTFKIGEAAPPPPLLGRGLGPHLTQTRLGWGLPPYCMPSFILIRPTVWPQYTSVTDRTDRQRTDWRRNIV